MKNRFVLFLKGILPFWVMLWEWIKN